jgi:hypothetical protein
MAFIHLTEGTGSGAGWPHQQKASRSLGVAFSPIWTAAFFADRMNLTLFNNLLHSRNLTSLTDGTAQPIRHIFN